MTSTLVDRLAGVAEGLAVKAPVRVATTANITLAEEQTIDGIAVVEGDRVLVKDQTNPTQNGIYGVSTGNWARTDDFDGARDVIKGSRVFVIEGTISGGAEFMVDATEPVVPGASSIAFTLVSGSGLTSVLLAGDVWGDFQTIASAATTDIGDLTSVFASVTGGVEITSFGTAARKLRVVRFGASLTLKHDGTALILPGAVDIAVSAGDAGIFKSDASGNWRCVSFQKASGQATVEGRIASITDVASAATCDIGASLTQYVRVTGTVGITSLGTKPNRLRIIRFADALLLTHNATSLKLPGSVNILTEAGDIAWALSDASGNWLILSYTRASGLALNNTSAPRLVKMYRTQDGGNNPGVNPTVWAIEKPDGTQLDTTGTTTQGLQEAMNYAAGFGYDLQVLGGGIAAQIFGVDYGGTCSTNPFTMTNSSKTVTVQTDAAHNLTPGKRFKIFGTPGAVRGIPQAELCNIELIATSVTPTTITFDVSTTAATSGGTGGGSGLVWNQSGQDVASIVCAGGLDIPPLQGVHWEIHASLQCNSPSAGGAVRFNSVMASEIIFRYQVLTTAGWDSAVLFQPRDELPQDPYGPTITASTIIMPSICPGDNSQKCVDLDDTYGTIGGNQLLQFTELNAGSHGVYAPGRGFGITNNIIVCGGAHGQTVAGIVLGEDGASPAVVYGNTAKFIGGNASGTTVIVGGDDNEVEFSQVGTGASVGCAFGVAGNRNSVRALRNDATAKVTGLDARNSWDGFTNTAGMAGGTQLYYSQFIGMWNGAGGQCALLAKATSQAAVGWWNTGGGADAKKWDAVNGGGTFSFRAVNDADSVAPTIWRATRTGVSAISFALGNVGGFFGTLDVSGMTANRNYAFSDVGGVIGILDTDITLAGNSDSRAPSQKAIKSYTDNLLTGLKWKTSVVARTTGALAANTYNNGTSGVGATLTGNANGALAAQDGVTLTSGQRLLVANEATGANNGIYVVTQVGTGSLPYILTRATDADASAELPNATMFVEQGTTYADTQWTITNNSVTVGTTAIVVGQVSGAGTYSAGNGLLLSGTSSRSIRRSPSR